MDANTEVRGGEVMASKMKLPKCPHCGKEYKEKFGEYALMHLVTQGWTTEEIVTCPHCNEKYKVTVKIMYYGSKIKEAKQ